MDLPKKRLLFLSPSVASGKEQECVVDDFESISNRAIGEGAFGEVFKVRHISTGNLYAIKMISKQKILAKNMLAQLRRELRIMYSLDHPYIIKLYNHFEDDKNFFLIMQLADGGALFNKLVKVHNFDEKTTAQYMREVALAVQYLHTRDPAIIHRDIKPENIFLDKDGRVKLGDFGWSSFSDNVRSTYCGTLEYLAPEMIDRRGHDTRLDLWNLGVLLFELLVGRAPFQSTNQEELFSKIKSLKVGFPKNFPDGAKNLVKGLLKANPDERITIVQLLQHPWITQHPPLRLTCELQTKIEAIPEDLNIPESQYKVISKADNTQQILEQEKLISMQLRTKIKKSENDIHILEGTLKKLQEKQDKLSYDNIYLQSIITNLSIEVLSNNLLDSENLSLSEMQEDLDNKIVKLQVSMRKIDFERRIKLKEANEKRKILLAKEIKHAVVENTFLGLRSYSKEFKWLQNLSRSLFYLQEFKKIIELIYVDTPDNLVHSYIDELRNHYDNKPELQHTVEEIQDLILEKFYSVEELEEKVQELNKISVLKNEVYAKILPKKLK